MVTGNIENGIAVTYDDAGVGTGKLNFDVNDPVITLSGDVSGSATMTNLSNTTIVTTVANDSHTHDGRYYTETESDNRFVPLSNNGERVQDIVGGMVTGNSESGITVTYNDAGTNTGKLDFNVHDPVITLSGDVTGSATMTNLTNTTITTTVANDSHTHDTRYYTETESDTRFVNASGDTMTGALAMNGNAITSNVDLNLTTGTGSNALVILDADGRGKVEIGNASGTDSSIYMRGTTAANLTVVGNGYSRIQMNDGIGIGYQTAGQINSYLPNNRGMLLGSTGFGNNAVAISWTDSGTCYFNNRVVKEVATPLVDTDAANKVYVDDAIAAIPSGTLEMNAGEIPLGGAGVDDQGPFTSYTKVKEIFTPVGGEFRLKWQMQRFGNYGFAYARVYRNGVAISAEFTTTSSSKQWKVVDVAGWVSGDLIQLYVKTDATSDDGYGGSDPGDVGWDNFSVNGDKPTVFTTLLDT